jgi:anti-sigma factor RsiW
MHCLDVQPDLEAYVDGELGPERVALLEQHLAGCDACRAELARLQAVVDAMETWPLVAEPARLTARVMAQVRPRPTPPRFRVHWGDLAISLAGAGLAFTFMLLWRYLFSTRQIYLFRPQVYLRLEMLRLEAVLWMQRLANTGAVAWELVLAGVALAAVASVAIWHLTVWEPRTFSAPRPAR